MPVEVVTGRKCPKLAINNDYSPVAVYYNQIKIPDPIMNHYLLIIFISWVK